MRYYCATCFTEINDNNPEEPHCPKCGREIQQAKDWLTDNRMRSKRAKAERALKEWTEAMK